MLELVGTGRTRSSYATAQPRASKRDKARRNRSQCQGGKIKLPAKNHNKGSLSFRTHTNRTEFPEKSLFLQEVNSLICAGEHSLEDRLAISLHNSVIQQRPTFRPRFDAYLKQPGRRCLPRKNSGSGGSLRAQRKWGALGTILTNSCPRCCG